MSDKDTEAAANCEVCRVKCWTREGFFGKYSYKYLCTPTVSCLGKGANAPMWLGKDEKLPLLLSVVLGLQHCLAMLAGIATSGGLLIAGDTCMAFQCALQPFMVSTSWLASGILTLIQVFRCKIRGTPFYLGTGLISVMGTSFTFLPIAREMTTAYIQDAKNTGDPRCVTLDSGVIDCPRVGMEGYGAFLGTCMVACFLEIAISFIPSRIRAKMFPPVVLGVAVMMIGAGLVSSGIKYVGGGVFCGENMATRAAAFGSGPQICNENGDVTLAFGAPQHIGLAASVILFGVVLNVAGSPFLKSTFLFWGLVFGTIVAAISSYTDDEGIQYDYFGDSAKEKVDAAPAFVFFWSEDQFPISFDIVYLLPILLATYITTAETVGDVTMTALYSGITDPEDVNERIQGGLLADGVNSFLACCFGTAPNTTFSQNNGIIKLSQCASRSAGLACAIWLILLGIFG
ncbi:hypothetical protein EMIHUDRAFT_253368, partial [Emiliania huxleyi CCMP1516]|uniref:Uncharacterized protein n=2 Tax=Emiliania huxleyi TaxID=2903 RepID=A0A0D3K9C2_EMIH1